MWRSPLPHCVLVLSLLASGTTADAQRATRAKPSKAAKIADAMSAAPASIARNATIKDWPATEGGEMPVLRAGTNGWVCLPTPPTSHVPDAMCIDAEWEKWLAAYLTKSTPQVTQVAYSYMLNSRSAGSNTDPFATKPTPDNHWHAVGPHVMVLYPDAKMYDGISDDPKSGGPYVMWKGTPYVHVMWPIRDVRQR